MFQILSQTHTLISIHFKANGCFDGPNIICRCQLCMWVDYSIQNLNECTPNLHNFCIFISLNIFVCVKMFLFCFVCLCFISHILFVLTVHHGYCCLFVVLKWTDPSLDPEARQLSPSCDRLLCSHMVFSWGLPGI